jgi:esterase/lipase superfamily enzyme
MKRAYEKWYSPSLGREMEMLVFGHQGVPVVVFPTSCGRFHEFEDQGMVGALWGKIESGQVQLFCVDSVDGESWYNRDVPPRWKIARQMQYQEYILREVLPYVRNANHDAHLVALGTSFGAYHATNLALKHPDLFTGFLTLGGAFDVSAFLHGYHDQDVYFNMPPQYLAQMSDPWFLDRYRNNTYVLATGEWDICLGSNQRMADVMRSRGIPVRLEVWGSHSMHDWPEWRRMVECYL